jgi:photosystem II stability/assembly factor-like uncharacterized protein
MKRFVSFFLFAAALAATVSHAQINTWRWQNPLPIGNFLRGVQMLTPSVTVACGDNGCFVRTSDDGITWDTKSNVLGFKGGFYSLYFTSDNFGLMAGDSARILRTTDGGENWTVLAGIRKKTTEKLNSIIAVTENIYIVVGSKGGVFRSSDAGTNWDGVYLENTLPAENIREFRPDFLAVTGYGGLLARSADSGKTWIRIALPVGNTFYSSIFTSDSSGTLIGEYGEILHSSDAGSSWATQNVDGAVITANLNSVDGRDGIHYAAVGDYGTLLYTDDGGEHWKQSFLATRDPIKGVSFINSLEATAVGKNGIILRTTDGGSTWAYLPHKPLIETLNAIAFAKGDTSLGIAVGNNGTILHTTDGGANWNNVTSPTSQYLRGVAFAGASTVIAVGDNGTILKSSDAGLTWAPAQSGTKKNLHAVAFYSSDVGVAVGDSSAVLRTMSGGLFWTRLFLTPPSDSDRIAGVTFPDSSHVFLVSDQSIYVSRDAGFTFTQLPGAHRGVGISFADSLTGAIVYADKYGKGYVQVTHDGGVTVDSIYPPNVQWALTAVHFPDVSRATVVGMAGYIAHSADSGKTWVAQQSNTLNNLNAVNFSTVQAGTTVGYRGNILRIKTDEKPLLFVPRGASGTPEIEIANYPNPFSVRTTIEYFLPGAGNTTFAIYTVEGKLVVNTSRGFELSGDHSILFDASGLSSGEYICRIESGGLIRSIRLKVVK